MPAFILASASPRRIDLLKEAGFDFKVHPANIPEYTQKEISDPIALVEKNAQKKASAIAPQYPEQWIIGADTIVVINQQVLGKPTDLSEAKEMLQKLNGKTHTVITAVCFTQKNTTLENINFHETTHVTFKKLSPQEIDNYLTTINPLDKAGGYAAQEGGEKIIHTLEGSYTNVVGLPMERFIKEWGKIA